MESPGPDGHRRMGSPAARTSPVDSDRWSVQHLVSWMQRKLTVGTDGHMAIDIRWAASIFRAQDGATDLL